MAVGKESIKRAASAGAAAKKAADTKETAVKAETAKAAPKKTTKTTAKTAAAKTTKAAATKKTGTKAASAVKASVTVPANAEEIQVKFMKGETAAAAPGRPIRICEELPVYLL